MALLFPTINIAQQAENDALIKYLFRDFQGDKPGASFAVIKNNEIIAQGNYGLAEVEKKIPTSAKTNYRIASVSKQFTAAAIQMLVERKQLKYKTKLSKIFSAFPAYGKDITLHHLLTHRAGLIEYGNFLEEGRTEQILDAEILQTLMKQEGTLFPPNSKYKYSNSGYAVLAETVAKVSGMSFKKFVESQIFAPLDMKNSKVFLAEEAIPNRAYGYSVGDTSIVQKDQNLSSAVQGDGGIYMSVADYFKWDQALYEERILTDFAKQVAFTAYHEDGATMEEGYGYGWRVRYEKERKILEHGGASTGFGSYVIRVPRSQLSIVIFTNRSRVGSELPTMARALLSVYSDGFFTMPIEVMIQKELEGKGWGSAEKLYQEIKLESDKYDISESSLYSLGLNYLRKNQLDTAEKLFRLSLVEYPDFYGGYYGMANVNLHRDDSARALIYFYKTVELAPVEQQGIINFAQQKIKELE